VLEEVVYFVADEFRCVSLHRGELCDAAEYSEIEDASVIQEYADDLLNACGFCGVEEW
jgi:hypothetical protein